MLAYLWVFLGGGLGSACRFGLARALQRYALNFPLATLAANLLACLLLGYLVGRAAHGGVAHPHRHLWMIGFCGGFSTFSTFSAEWVALLQGGQPGQALLYVGLSLASCGLGISAGVWLAGLRAS